MAGTEPALHATRGSSGPSHCHGRNRYLRAWGTTGDACVIGLRLLSHLAFSPSRSPESLPRTPELLARGPGSLPTPERHPRALRRSPVPTPSLRIILYSSFQTVQYSLGYSYYYQVAGIVKVGVVRSLAFIPYFFVLLSMCINY